MATLEICSVDDPTDNEINFSDSYNAGDWDGLELMINEDNLITTESRKTSPSVIEKYRKECWQCNSCNTINNVRQCIMKHGSRCIGCKNECYIESQTPTIMHSEYHANDKLFTLQMEQLWQCELCLMINDKLIPNCTECENPSPMTLIRNKISKFTEKQRATHLIHGFVRLLEYYLEIGKIYYALLSIIQNFYFIDYLEEGWMIGTDQSMSITTASNLRVGDQLDFRNDLGKFELAEVMRNTIIRNSECKIALKLCDPRMVIRRPRRHPPGMRRISIHHTWHCYNQYPFRFAEAGTVSARPAHRLTDIRVGDPVDINPIYNHVKEHRAWKHGTVIDRDSKSGQVLVVYKYKGKNWRYWTHLDNEDEISEYESKTGGTGYKLYRLLRDDIKKQEGYKTLINYK